MHAMTLAARGAKIVVADNGTALDGEGNSSGPADDVVAEIRAAGGEAVVCTADISTEAGSTEAVEACVKAFGRIDGILHNASTSPNLSSVAELSSRDTDIVMRVNAYAGMWMTRAAWPYMVKQNYGRIVYTTSAAAFGTYGDVHYAAAKAAMIGVMRCIAPEGANHGITVNLIAPSARSRMTELFNPSPYADWFFKKMPPEKVTIGAAYLMSEACTVNGEIFSLGGGRIARITLAEAEGVLDLETIEDVAAAMPRVMADPSFFFPKNLSERSTKVSDVLGFKGGLEATTGFAVRPIGSAD